MAQQSRQAGRRSSRAWVLTKAWIMIATAVTVIRPAFGGNVKAGLVLFLLTPFMLLADMLWFRLRRLTELPNPARRSPD